MANALLSASQIMSTASRQPSPYTPPTVPLEDVMQDIYEPRLFAFEGRIGRIRFLGYSSLAFVLVFVLLFLYSAFFRPQHIPEFGFDFFDGILVLMYCLLLATPLIYARRRLHDIGVSGWQALMLLIPFLGIWAFYYLAFTRGNAGLNAYGSAPRKNRVLTIAGAIIMPPLALACLWLAISIAFYFTSGRQAS